MKPGSFIGRQVLIIGSVIGISLALLSWDQKKGTGNNQQKTQYYDTIPQKKDKKIRDLDEAIAELENIDLQIHLDNAMKEVKQALKEIDSEKIRLDVEKAMKEVDFQKIRSDVEKVMKDVDFAKIEREVKESFAKIDWEKMKMEFEAIKKIDLPEMEADLARARDEIKKIGPEIEKELKKAKIEIEKAKVEMKEYKLFIDGLHNDGLINKETSYSIIYKNGKLHINEQEVPEKIYEKYRSFLNNHEKFNINKDKGDFNIDRE